MNLRIQTWGTIEVWPDTSPRLHADRVTDNVSVFEVLRKGLDDLADLCDVVEDKFTISRDEFNAKQPDNVESP